MCVNSWKNEGQFNSKYQSYFMSCSISPIIDSITIYHIYSSIARHRMKFCSVNCAAKSKRDFINLNQGSMGSRENYRHNYLFIISNSTSYKLCKHEHLLVYSLKYVSVRKMGGIENYRILFHYY